MKKTLPILTQSIIYTFLFLMIASCGTTNLVQLPNKTIEADYNKSLQRWNTFKKEHNNSYEYTVNAASFTGYYSLTRIMVKNGIVASRTFLDNDVFEDKRPAGQAVEKYTEGMAELNTHENGFKAITIDEIYATCAGTYLVVNEKENEISFSVDDLGLIKYCGYYPKGCMDDCSRGVSISNFKWID